MSKKNAIYYNNKLYFNIIIIFEYNNNIWIYIFKYNFTDFDIEMSKQNTNVFKNDAGNNINKELNKKIQKIEKEIVG